MISLMNKQEYPEDEKVVETEKLAEEQEEVKLKIM